MNLEIDYNFLTIDDINKILNSTNNDEELTTELYNESYNTWLETRYDVNQFTL